MYTSLKGSLYRNLLVPYILLALVFVHRTQCLCGDSIKWSHRVHMDDIYGYAQHNLDRTNVPNAVGCVSLYITDVNEYEDWLDWSIPIRNYSSRNWRSSNSNPWSGNSLAGAWMDVRVKRKVKRNVEGQRRVRVLWDEDGHTLEQIYVYYEEEPGLWTADQLRPLEKELISRGIDVWYPDEPPRHPDVIRIVNLTPQTLILNHCAEAGNSGIFSLILRRSPAPVQKWEWRQYQQQFYKFDLPNVYRFFAICGGCTPISSMVVVLLSIMSLIIQNIM